MDPQGITKNKPTLVVNGVSEIKEQSLPTQILEAVLAVGELVILLFVYLYYCGESIYKCFQPDPPKDVKGEIVLITGTGHGIGKELAMLYASKGATVVGWDLNEENNQNTVKELAQLGYPKAYSFVCDVSNRENVLEVAKKVQKTVGDVTILINNAGIMPTRPLLEHTPQEIEKIMGINIMAHFWTLEAFLPAMKKNNHGHIVSLSSMAGQVGLVNLVPYCASKFAVTGLMEALHEELRRNKNNNIHLTNICPFMVNTGLCKNPKIRFESIMPILDPKSVAQEIYTAQTTNQLLVCLPKHLRVAMLITRLFPVKAAMYAKDKFEAIVDSDAL